MSNAFRLGESSSIEDAVVGPVFREGEHAGHELFSYRGEPMGIEVGDGCVLFRESEEMEELHEHLDWTAGAAYRAASIAKLRGKGDAPEVYPPAL